MEPETETAGRKWMREAIEMAKDNVQSRGGPFGALVVRDEAVIAWGVNLVTAENDPTAHAEVVAIRKACEKLNTFQLSGCTLYTSCEPCPMCLGAIYWARLDRVFYAATRDEAAEAGFDDAFIYDELTIPPSERSIPMEPCLRDEAEAVFEAWAAFERRIQY